MNEHTPHPQLMGLLARALARGKTLSWWARETDVHEETARAWTELPEFPALVEKARREEAEKALREIADRTAKAMDGLAAAAGKKKAIASTSLAEAKALIEKWVELTANLEQGKKIAELEERLAILEETRAAYIKIDLGGSRN